MIITRYISREILTTLLGVLVVLLVIYIGNHFIRLLARTGDVAMPLLTTLQLLGYKSVGAAVLLIPPALFLAVLMTLGRLYKESEMAAMMACGISIRKIYQAVMGLSLLVALCLGGLSLFVAPWAEEQGYRIQDQEKARSSLESMVAGRFVTFGSGAGAGVIYVAKRSKDKKAMEDVFIQTKIGDRQVLLYARQAVYRDEGNVRYLVLKDGYRYEGVPGDDEFRVVRYGEHGMRIPEQNDKPVHRKKMAFPTMGLLRSANILDIAELQWRVSMPLAALVLAILAVPLSRASPREGKFSRLFGALLMYVMYSNLLGVAHSWLERGMVSPWLGMWWVHGLMLLITWVVLMRQYGTIWVIKGMLGRTMQRENT